MLQLVF